MASLNLVSSQSPLCCLLFTYFAFLGFKLNNKLNQLLVARYADKEVIDFDNFVSCLVKLETVLSRYQLYPYRSSTCVLRPSGLSWSHSLYI